ncbi:ankyrin repeat domain-containing protein [Mesorhizobium sp. M0522]|uniref:ankyrin repeat domain-containing protein n=1 Tax=Mesorhizobium sp. M0522 TaxID=2956958 RepID=UPI00333BE80C
MRIFSRIAFGAGILLPIIYSPAMLNAVENNADVDRSMIVSILRRDANGVQEAIENGANPHAVIYINFAGGQVDASALSIAVVMNEEDIVYKLVDAGAYDKSICLMPNAIGLIEPINSILPEGVRKATVQSSILGQSSLRCFLERGRYRVPANDSRRSFFDAIAVGDLEGVSRILASGIDVNLREDTLPSSGESGAKYSGRTPLHVAVLERRTEIIQLLIKAGSDLNAQAAVGSVSGGWDGFTPLMLAIAVHEITAMDLLMDAGARLDVTDADGWSAIHHASADDDNEILAQLLEGVADHGLQPILESLTKSGDSPLSLASRGKAVENVSFLLALGKRCDRECNLKPLIDRALVESATLRLYGAMSELEKVTLKKKSGEIIKLLLDAGGDCNASDENGTPILAIAARDGLDISVIQDIISRGADTKRIDLLGNSVEYYSAARNDFSNIKILLERKRESPQ